MHGNKKEINWEYLPNLFLYCIDMKILEKELIQKIRKGESEPFMRLLEIYKLMIYSIINSYQLEYGDYIISKDDLFQEGCLALLEACQTYKDNYNAKFSTYAYVLIERRIQRAFYHYLKPYKEEYSLDKYEHLDHLSSAVADNSISYVELRNTENDFINGLKYISEEDKNILRLRLLSYTYKEIADELHISVKRVDNRINRMRKIYRQNGTKKQRKK